MPILVVTLVAILIGLPVMIMTSRSISDPVREVVDAMAKVERGRIDTFVGVYEKSEIGRLQNGFNRMVAGIGERDRLRDLFGRHVGADVARRAIEEGTSLSGDVREAAILFIDLVGSTKLTASRPPQEVARYSTTSSASSSAPLTTTHGLINKFQGDAALAVFGAPLALDGAASAALATARRLRDQLRSATDGRLRDRRIGRAGVRRKHRRRKPLRIHRCRRCGQRGGATGRLRQNAGPTDRVFGCRNRARRRCRAPALGRQWRDRAARPSESTQIWTPTSKD